MSAGPAVRATGLSKRFHFRGVTTDAVAEVSFTIGAGEFVAVLGPSGCGKSTVLRMIADLESPSGGTAEVFGKTPAQARLDQDMAVVFQQAGLLAWKTVRENAELPLALRRRPAAERRARSDELLAMIGLTEFAGHRPAQLSGGMQQRVAIARALACQPSLLLMDEPLGALDEMTREHMQDELRRISAETGTAVLFVTHSISEAVFLADRVLVMSSRPGRIQADVSTGLRSGVASDNEIRESQAFFDKVTEVREALRHSHPSEIAVP